MPSLKNLTEESPRLYSPLGHLFIYLIIKAVVAAM
jgi:hypothetical protein